MIGKGDDWAVIRPDLTEVITQGESWSICLGYLTIGRSRLPDGTVGHHFMLGPFGSVPYTSKEMRAVIQAITRDVEEVERGE